MERVIPQGDWHRELAAAIRDSVPGDRIVVDTQVKKDLGLAAMNRMNKTGITFEVRPVPGEL